MEEAIILTFATTGVRRAELIGIRIEDVDWQGQRIRIRGKGGKERQVIISPQLQRALWVYLHDKNLSDQSPLFPSRTGRQFHNSTLQRWFKRWLEQAALEGKGFTIHSLRRYAATRWLRHGLNVREIQVLLGHESPETTARYLSVDLEEIQKHVSQLPAISEKVMASPDSSKPDAAPAPSVAAVDQSPALLPDNLEPLAEILARLDAKTVNYLLEQAQMVGVGAA